MMHLFKPGVFAKDYILARHKYIFIDFYKRFERNQDFKLRLTLALGRRPTARGKNHTMNEKQVTLLSRSSLLILHTPPHKEPPPKNYPQKKAGDNLNNQ